VPVSIKDLHFLAGARLTMGTRSMAAFVAPMDDAVNGLVGLKASRDRISNGPVRGELAFGLSTSGAITGTVADAALALDVMAGYELGDPGQAPPPARAWREEVSQSTGHLRIGVPPRDRRRGIRAPARRSTPRPACWRASATRSRTGPCRWTRSSATWS
jgi:Asp-tRNA(Asn)/Glu-tRNA(Gln) amidotransferase A subunit family amidase